MKNENVLIFVGAIESNKWLDNNKELSRNFHQGYRVYCSSGIANTIQANSIGGFGGYSGLYLVKDEQNSFCRNH